MKNLSILVDSINSNHFGKIYLITDTISNSTDLLVYASREDAEFHAKYKNSLYPERNFVVEEALIHLS